MKTYTVVAERDEAGWWAVRVLELPGVLTQARRLDQVEKFAREAIDLAMKVGQAPKGKYDVQIDPACPGLVTSSRPCVQSGWMPNGCRPKPPNAHTSSLAGSPSAA